MGQLTFWIFTVLFGGSGGFLLGRLWEREVASRLSRESNPASTERPSDPHGEPK